MDRKAKPDEWEHRARARLKRMQVLGQELSNALAERDEARKMVRDMVLAAQHGDEDLGTVVLVNMSNAVRAWEIEP